MIFETVDPLNNKICLTQSTWNLHIMKRHPEFAGKQSLIQSVIENPAFILVDNKDFNRTNYLELCKLPADNTLSMLKVVVDCSSEIGDVVTAYVCKSTEQAVIPKGGIKYERSK